MKKALAPLSLLLAALALAACGSSDNNSTTTPANGGGGGGQPAGGGGTTKPAGGASGGGGQTLQLSADPNGALKFDTASLSAKAGNDTIDFDNPAAISHDVAIEDSSGQEIGKSDLVAQGKTTLSVNLKPGKYTFFCSVPGHREGGMEGTLTVK